MNDNLNQQNAIINNQHQHLLVSFYSLMEASHLHCTCNDETVKCIQTTNLLVECLLLCKNDPFYKAILASFFLRMTPVLLLIFVPSAIFWNEQ